MAEFVIELLMLIVSVFLLVKTGDIPSHGGQTVGSAAFWPQIVLLIIIISTMTLLAKPIFRKAVTWKGFCNAIALNKDQRRVMIRVSAVMALCIIYTFSIRFLGFILASLIFQVLILLSLGTRRWVTLIATPLWLTASLYVLFVRIIHISLPRGVGLFSEFSRLFY